jgi:spore germination cell wall hydrolase CwlJ-like protein
MFALAVEDRSVLKPATKAPAGWPVLTSAALLGAGVGLGLGAAFLNAGIARDVAEHARAEQRAELAANGYGGSYLEARGAGLRLGLLHYAFRDPAQAKAYATLFADPRTAAKAKRRADLECLTDAVYYEARSEDSRGQFAVAQVVLNRVKHPAFPKSVCGVVFQGAGHSGCQFSFTCDGSMRHGREEAAWDRARHVAARALAGVVVANIGQATHYHTTAVSPFWAPSMLRVAQVGVHVFYRFSPSKAHPLPPGVPVMEKAVLTSGGADQIPQLRLEPALVEKAVEASLAPASPEAKPAASPPKPAEAALLTAPQSAVSGAS